MFLLLLFFLSMIFFLFKFDRLIFLLIGMEVLFFSLFMVYSFSLESVGFIYYVFFGVLSSVGGLTVFFLVVSSFGKDKSMFYFL